MGCGTQLSLGDKKAFDNDNKQVSCKCKRVYIYNQTSGKYRRALINEVE